MSLTQTNLKIFGISKVKTLSDFVTSEKDVQKGNNRVPLNLARIHEEDLVKEADKTSDQLSKMSIDEKNGGDDALAEDLKHR